MSGLWRGGQESDDCWVEHGRTACCFIPTPFSSPCIPYVTQRALHSSPESEVAPTESPDTAKRHEGRECWHGRGQQAEVKGSVQLLLIPIPACRDLVSSCPREDFLNFCPCFRTAKSLAHRLLAARAAIHEQFYLPL